MDFLKEAEDLRPRIKRTAGSAGSRKALGEGDSVVLDFRKHFTGDVSMHFSAKGFLDAPVAIKVFCAENRRELKENPDDYSGWVSRGWIQEEELHLDEFPCRLSLSRRYAVRYIRVTVLSCPKGCSVTVTWAAVMGRTAVWQKLEPAGATEMEKKLDAISLATLSECVRDVFEDGAKRDQRLWAGDLKLEALANYETYRLDGLVKRCLFLFAGTAMNNGGICQSVSTKGHVCGDGQTNFDYPLLYVSTIADYLENTGDAQAAAKLLPVAERQIELARERFNGSMVRDGEMGWCFLDWSFELNRQAGAQAVYVYAERALARIMRALDMNAEEYERDADEKAKAAYEAFWDNGRCLVTSGSGGQISYASAVWFVLAGILDKEESRDALDAVAKCRGAVKPVTPYMMHYYVQALLDCGEKDKAYDVMMSYWGGMAKAGADTFWEMYDPKHPDFSPYGGTAVLSYCHGWSCTPAYFLRRYFLK